MSSALLALAGLGLVLFGVRSYVNALDEPTVERVRRGIAEITSTPLRAMAAGLGATALLQASSITVLGAMGLVQRQACRLDAAIYLVLGATIGTTLKAWIVALPFSVLGPVLVASSSAALVLVRRRSRRRVLEIVLALGLLYLGWWLMASQIEPTLSSATIRGGLAGLEVSSLVGLAWAIGVGFLLTVLIQSSSALVFLVLGLLDVGWLSFPVAAALVLGGNVGTTVTPLCASLEYRSDVRALALVYLAIKGLGAAVVGLFFYSFLGGVLWLLQVAQISDPALQLAGVHTAFNVVNVLIWAPLVPLLSRVALRHAPSLRRERFLLSAPVRRLLRQVPEEALEQIDAETTRCLQDAKISVDGLLVALASPEQIELLRKSASLKRRLVALRELLAAVAIRRSGDPEIFRRMRALAALEELIEQRDVLVGRLALEQEADRVARARALAGLMPQVSEQMEPWWALALGVSAEIAEPDRVAELEAWAFAEAPPGSLREGDLVALGRTLAPLRTIWWRLIDLSRAVAPSVGAVHDAASSAGAGHDPAPGARRGPGTDAAPSA